MRCSVPPCLRRDESFDYYFVTNSLPSFLSKHVKDLSTFGKSTARKLIASSVLLCVLWQWMMSLPEIQHVAVS